VSIKEKFEEAVKGIKRFERPHFKRHHDDEIIDKVEIAVVPRYKTSGLSGDEWRTSMRLRLWRKGHLLVERSYHGLKDAVAALPWVLRTWAEATDPYYGKDEDARWLAFLKEENWLCHQVGCSEPATRVYKLKELFSERGEKLDADEHTGGGYVVGFCEKHALRGDCGREDADRNYEQFIGAPPGKADFPAEEESPSAFGGFIDGDNLDEMPERLRETVAGMMPDRRRD